MSVDLFRDEITFLTYFIFSSSRCESRTIFFLQPRLVFGLVYFDSTSNASREKKEKLCKRLSKPTLLTKESKIHMPAHMFNASFQAAFKGAALAPRAAGRFFGRLSRSVVRRARRIPGDDQLRNQLPDIPLWRSECAAAAQRSHGRSCDHRAATEEALRVESSRNLTSSAFFPSLSLSEVK